MNIAYALRNILEHQFSKHDYTNEAYEKDRLNLIMNLESNKNFINFLKFLVQLTAIDNQFIQSGSNAFNLLVSMKVDLKNQCLENIKIKNTALTDGNFVGCNFSGSELENVDISGVNFNGALLLNCQWKNI